MINLRKNFYFYQKEYNKGLNDLRKKDTIRFLSESKK